VEITAEEDICFLYIVWDRIPGPWTLAEETNGSALEMQCGQGLFLHEYVALDAPSKHVTLKAPADGCLLCDIFCYGAGDVPANVQQWKPYCEDADMLLISTHADDEHLFFGGTMPTYAGELGYDVQIAYLTHHWEQPVRPHELLDGLWTVGMTHYPVISTFTDYYSDNLEHAKTLWDLDEVEAYEVMLLRRFKPEVVIDHDVNGEYGHGAHMLNTWVLQQAIEWAADPSWRADETAAAGSYLEAAQKLPAFQVSKVYLHLWPENAVHMNWDKPLERFDGKTAFEMAVEGFACHASQQQWFKVGRKGVFDCMAFGLYYTNVGVDTQLDDPDFFENITEEDFSDFMPEPAAPPKPMSCVATAAFILSGLIRK
jgi:LmbE family N-acetylglucosaminyl deacetylase